jgi:hypothetical protein
MTISPLHKRRFQYSLSMCFLIILVGIPPSLFFARCRERQRAAEILQTSGWKLTFEKSNNWLLSDYLCELGVLSGDVRETIESASFNSLENGGKSNMEMLSTFLAVRKIELFGIADFHDDVHTLPTIPNLREVRIHSRGVSNDVCAVLASLHGIETLDVKATSIDDSGFSNLGKMHELRSLSCPRLLTSRSISTLCLLEKLERIDLMGCKFKPSDLANVRENFPDAAILPIQVDNE